jgi:hypothetical protein
VSWKNWLLVSFTVRLVLSGSMSIFPPDTHPAGEKFSGRIALGQLGAGMEHTDFQLGHSQGHPLETMDHDPGVCEAIEEPSA